MSVTLDLSPDLEAEAKARAQESGIPLETFLESVLRLALAPTAPPSPLSAEEFDALMDSIAEGSDDLPVPPVMTREMIYSDHD